MPSTVPPSRSSTQLGSTLGPVFVVELLAHQGGWDEILLVAGPLVVFGGLLAVARRRAVALSDQQADEEPIA